ncbi:MAG: hypothetical protein LBP89_10460 [Helicobacteraceae bacterium]|nr:hypothetical protein [Helicobacteraceae bacterium]
MISQKRLFTAINIGIETRLSRTISATVYSADLYEIGYEKSVSGDASGVKIGYERFGDYGLRTVRVNLIYHIAGGKSELKIAPEIGLSLFTYLSLSYGYGFHIAKDKIDKIDAHRFAFRINIYLALSSALDCFLLDIPMRCNDPIRTFF